MGSVYALCLSRRAHGAQAGMTKTWRLRDKLTQALLPRIALLTCYSEGCLA
jgi:hypothetical protein